MKTSQTHRHLARQGVLDASYILMANVLFFSSWVI